MKPTMKLTKTFIALIAVVCLFSTGAGASERVSKYVSDSTIKGIVERNLERHRLTKKEGADIQVTVDDHIVTLSGTVPSLTLMREAEEQAWHANNDVRIENHLSVRSTKTDSELAEEVGRAIRRYPRNDIFDWVDASVQDGVVTLTGAVTQPYRKTDYVKVLEEVPGVKQIENGLHVLPLSNFDDEIRDAAARAIYQDPLFARYAHETFPPIHIIVENGKLTLKGVVATPMEKQIAETNVRTRVMAFAVVNELSVEQTS